MKRELTKAEVLAQIAEKERRINQHLQVMKDQGDFVSHSLKGRAQDAGEKLKEIAEQAKELAPSVAGAGLGLWLASRVIGGLFRRRKHHRLERMSHEEIVLLSDALIQRIAQSGTLAPHLAIPPLPTPLNAERADPVGEPVGTFTATPARGRKDDFVSLLLAALAGAALKVALEHVDWQRLYETVRQRIARARGEEVSEEVLALPANTTGGMDADEEAAALRTVSLLADEQLVVTPRRPQPTDFDL